MPSQKLRKILAPVLFPISLCYGTVTSVRNKLFDWDVLKSKSFNIPVISVGNITVGGTGKTPHVEYLIELLAKRFSTAILSRGYKRKTKGFQIAKKGASPESIGDEPYQIYSKYENVSVAVDEKRVHGIEQLLNINNKLQCFLLDDAFQHRHIKPGVSILLIDYYRPLKTDYVLPMGNLREKRYGVHRANIVIITKVPHTVKPIEKRFWIKELDLFPYQYLFFSGFQYGDLKSVFNRKKPDLSMDDLEKNPCDIVLLTGIANPQPLYDRLLNCSKELKLMQYADHHSYNNDDVKDVEKLYDSLSDPNKIIVCTEKDAVKLENLPFSKHLAQNLYYLPIQVNFLDNKGDEFDKLILKYVAEDKEINRLHR